MNSAADGWRAYYGVPRTADVGEQIDKNRIRLMLLEKLASALKTLPASKRREIEGDLLRLMGR